MQPMARASPSFLGSPAGSALSVFPTAGAATAAAAAAAHAENRRGYDFDAAVSTLHAASRLNGARAAKAGGTSLGGTARAIPPSATTRARRCAPRGSPASRLRRASAASRAWARRYEHLPPPAAAPAM
ncbi:hypothetical protein T492DRAFT_834901 [Pavlovales sp. CCMP2436]|nr:hypothetical protein T492DRAFT_834901 [Pavlovales sp. CCMP2436]